MFADGTFAQAPFAAQAAGGNVYDSECSSTASIVDGALVCVPVFLSSFADAPSATFLPTVLASSFSATSSSVATVSEEQSSSSIYLGTLSETASASYTHLVEASVFGASVSEDLVISDTALGLAVFIAAVTENGSAIDSFTARFLWELINTTQTASWESVNTN